MPGTVPVQRPHGWCFSRLVLPAAIGVLLALVTAQFLSVPLRHCLVITVIGVGVSTLLSYYVLLMDRRKFDRYMRERNRMIDLSLDMICVAGFDGYLKEVNPAFERITGWTRDEWQKTPFIERTHPDDRPRVDEVMKSLSEEKPLLDFESRTICKDGSARWFSINSFPVVRDGVVYAICRDITERKAHEATVLLLNEQLQARANDLTVANRDLQNRDRLFDLSLDMLCIAGLDGYFKIINPAFGFVLGWSDSELRAKPFMDFVHPDDRASTQDTLKQLGQGKPALEFENRYLCKNGYYKWLSWNSTAVLDAEMIYAVARDVTDRRKSEETILALNEQLLSRANMLDDSNRELEAFSYSVSHDLRAPLRHIVGFVQLLRKDLPSQGTESSQDYLQVIERSARQMGELIDDLLEFSRVGKTDLRLSSVDMNSLLQESIKAAGGGTVNPDIEWIVTPLPIVVGDRTLLKLVMENLLSNAIKYSRSRAHPCIEVGTQSTSQQMLPHGHMILYVRDNGVGFDMKHADQLFGVFQRLHKADEFEGTGIGLANVKRIVNRHGGQVWAEGVPGGGATFYVSLPGATLTTAGPA